MSFPHWLAALTVASLPLAAAAQQPQKTLDPGDPGAPVPALTYESAFKTFRSSREDGTSPDKAWRPANEEMGRLGGHAGQMKEAAPQAGSSPAAASPPQKQQGTTGHGNHH